MDPSQQDAMDITPDPVTQNQHYVHQDERAYAGNSYQTRPMTSQSTDVSYSPQMEINNSPSLSHQSTTSMQASRPPSGLSDATSKPAASYDPRSQSNGQEKTAQNSVVIKVGMVGDAQIGKTSLMVKYVEGSWDEDYIQTLGKSRYMGFDVKLTRLQASILWKRLSPYAIQKSPFLFGISVGNENSSICYPLSAMTL